MWGAARPPWKPLCGPWSCPIPKGGEPGAAASQHRAGVGLGPAVARLGRGWGRAGATAAGPGQSLRDWQRPDFPHPSRSTSAPFCVVVDISVEIWPGQWSSVSSARTSRGVCGLPGVGLTPSQGLQPQVCGCHVQCSRTGTERMGVCACFFPAGTGLRCPLLPTVVGPPWSLGGGRCHPTAGDWWWVLPAADATLGICPTAM